MFSNPTKLGARDLGEKSPVSPLIGPVHEAPKSISMPDMTPQNTALKGTTGDGHPVHAPHSAGKIPLKDGLVMTAETPSVGLDGRSSQTMPPVEKKWYS